MSPSTASGSRPRSPTTSESPGASSTAGAPTTAPTREEAPGRPVTTRATLSNGNRTLRLDNTAQECVYQNGGGYSKPNGIGGPAVSMFMEGATSATITMQGSGYSAVALGLVLVTDFGDAPVSYGSASALLQPRWDGGEVHEPQRL